MHGDQTKQRGNVLQATRLLSTLLTFSTQVLWFAHMHKQVCDRRLVTCIPVSPVVEAFTDQPQILDEVRVSTTFCDRLSAAFCDRTFCDHLW